MGQSGITRVGDRYVKENLQLYLMKLLNLMGVTTERVMRRQLIPQDDSIVG